MAIIERDVILQGKTESGQPTLDFPITRLSNIEASSDIKSKPEAGDYLPIIDGQDDGMKMVPVETLLPKEDNYVRSNKNFLRNAIFKHPVNRRGKTSYTINGIFTGIYPQTVDLWGTNASSAYPMSVIVSTEDQCITLVTKHYAHFLQKFIDPSDLLGKTVTISALIDRNIAGNVILGFNNPNRPNYGDTVSDASLYEVQPGLQLISYTTQVPESLAHDIFYAFICPVSVETAETEVSTKLYGMKVELGDTQTLARMNSDGVWELIDDPDYAEEYAYCEKYDLDDYSFVGDYRVNENFVPNWDFRNPMNSQGKTEYGDLDISSQNFIWDLKCLDDWFISRHGVKMTIKDGYINVKGKANTNSDFGWHVLSTKRKMRYCPFTNGDIITLSSICKVHQTTDTIPLGNVMIQIDNDTKLEYLTVSEDIEYDKLHFISGTFQVPDNWEPDDELRYTIYTHFSIDSDIDVYAFKIEFGSKSTLAHLDSNGRYVIHNTKSNMIDQMMVNQFSIYDGEYYPVGRSNPNLLDNWYFIDPINQRNQTTYGNGGTIDRWRTDIVGDSGILEIKYGYIRFSKTKNITVEGKSSVINSIFQKIYNVQFLAGKVVTLSMLRRGTGHNQLLLFVNNNQHLVSNVLYPSENWILDSYTVKLPDDLTFLSVFIYSDILSTSIGYTDLLAAKLEVGSNQTLARRVGDNWVLNDPPPDKALELTKCQRYFERTKFFICTGMATSNNTIQFCGTYFYKTEKINKSGAVFTINDSLIPSNQKITIQELNSDGTITTYEDLNLLNPVAYNFNMMSPRVQDPQNRLTPGKVYQVLLPDNAYDVSYE